MSLSSFVHARRTAHRPSRLPRRLPARLALAAAVLVAAIAAGTVASIPPPPSDAENLQEYIAANTQTMTVPRIAETSTAPRDAYGATPGVETLVAGGTNHDWAKLVLLYGGWPMSENNVTVITRWMRQENYVDSWWTRNNPLNNGYGSGGGGGLGSYANLVVAAEMAAENLHRHPGFQPIVDALATSAPTEVTEHAIWYSPWASGHYNDGAHWHYNPVEVVKAPPGAWG